MAPDASDLVPRPDRIETDHKLRAERERTDEELVQLSSVRDRQADEVVELARERADDLIAVAETKASAERSGVDGNADVVTRRAARASAQEIVNEERAAADDELAVERAELDRVLTRVLVQEREETDERLVAERERSDRAVASRDDFMAIVSHDVRGLLGSIALSADILSSLPDDAPSRGRVRAEAGRIQRLTARTSRLIGDLLDVVSIERGKLSMHCAAQDVARVVNETMENFQAAAASKDVKLTSTIAVGERVATFDHDRILQVLSNLVGNAIKFTPAGGTIAIHVTPLVGAIQFTVRDTGCGIASDQIESMFERFAQAADDRRGLGLGLYIARSIVEAHRGAIWAESQVGAGSAFHFTLPLVAA